jgi:hypothetical protein
MIVLIYPAIILQGRQSGKPPVRQLFEFFRSLHRFGENLSPKPGAPEGLKTNASKMSEK